MKYLKKYMFFESESIYYNGDEGDDNIKMIKDAFQEYIDEYNIEESNDSNYSSCGIFYDIEKIPGYERNNFGMLPRGRK